MKTHVCCLALAVGLTFQAAAESNTTNILDGVTTNAAGSFTLGDTGPFNFLLITNGGALTDTVGTIGNSVTAHSNLAVVTGTNSIWANAGSLALGNRGPANTLIVENVATLHSSSISVGNESSDNHAFIDNASVFNAGSLWVGTSSNACRNFLSLAGPGTVWTNASRITLGRDGSDNRITITDGAILRLGSPGVTGFTVGNSTTSWNNELTVSGSGSSLLGNWALTLGFTGSSNSFVASDGARVQTASADIGQNCIAGNNLAFITGAGTVWSNGQLQVGFCSTNNHLVVSNGAQVFAGLVRSSVQGGASNTIAVTGPGSLLRAAGDLVVGNSGTANSLLIADGGRVEGRNDRVGWSEGNTAFLSDSGTMWSNVSLTIGENVGMNRLTVGSGALIESGGVIMGAGAKSWGNEAMLSGANSGWTVTTNLIIGGLGLSNRLSLSESASLSARNVYLGAGSLLNPTALYNSDWNSLSLEGTNTVLNAVSNVSVGVYGRFNLLQILDGARVNDVDGVIGSAYGSRSNSVLVSGLGTVWSNASNLVVGSNGTRNELTISRGGRVADQSAYIGFNGEPFGEGSRCVIRQGGNKALVTDPGSLWENSGPLYVGYGSIGNTLVVSNGGTVRATNIIIGYSTGIEPGSDCGVLANANRLVVDGGCVIVSNETETARIEPRSGTLVIKSGLIIADQVYATGFGTSRVDLLGGTLRVKWGWIHNGLPLVVGDGLHNAHLEFADPPYWGALKFRSDDGIVVRPHARLSGVGTVDASVTNAGTLSPGGAKPGSLSLTRLSCLPQSRLHIDIAGGSGAEGDYLSLSFAGTLDGFLTVALRNGFVPSATDTFRILGGPVPFNGGFSNVAFGARLKTADSLGSFLVISNANRVELRDYQTTDLDGDTIEDAWATNHFGHSPLTPAEKLADADGDGVSNHDEFRAGTDPNDPASALKLSIVCAGHTATLSFPYVDGKEYRVWLSNNLRTWSEVTSPTFAYPSPGRCDWTDDSKDTGGLGTLTRFYRVTVD